MKKDQDPFKKLAPYYDLFMIKAGLYKTNTILKMVPLEPEQRILDLGGGTGYLARKLLGEKREIHVLDTSPQMTRFLQNTPVITTLGDGRATPYKEDFFHGVILSDTYHHIEEQNMLLQEIDRILAPGGFLLIHDFDKNSILTALIGCLEKLFISPVFYTTPQHLKEKILKRNYVLDKETYGLYWFIHVYKKLTL